MPPGDIYVTAVVSDFNQWPEQRAAIMLQAVGGRWHWSSLLLYRPPPVDAGVGEVAGYATLLTITDATVSVHFRTIGSRCCSDPTWNDRTIVLRRDGSTIYMRPGGVRATSLADSGSGIGADVWVRFSLSSLAPDGSYGLTDLVKMYPSPTATLALPTRSSTASTSPSIRPFADMAILLSS